MCQLTNEIPNSCYVAFSGGIDSVFALNFALLHGKREITAIYFNHGTKHGEEAQEFVEDYCKNKKVKLIIGNVCKEKEEDISYEEYWRNERYKFFHSMDKEVITGHNLNDAVEWWLFSCFNGKPAIIPTKNGNVIRPFLTMDRSKIENWAKKNNEKWIEDPSNKDRKYMRNLIRHDIVPLVKKVNKGVESVVKKMYIDKMRNKEGLF